jgi:hypothetical protein
MKNGTIAINSQSSTGFSRQVGNNQYVIGEVTKKIILGISHMAAIKVATEKTTPNINPDVNRETSQKKFSDQ